MATIAVSGDTLDIELRLWDMVLAVHGSLHIPLAHVRSAHADDAPPVPWFTKLLGTNMPGVKAAGTFYTSDGLAFYDYGAGHECVVLELDHETYKKVVIEVDPPQTAQAAAAQITAAIERVSRL